MPGIVCHITVLGRPFCECYQPEEVQQLRCTCGHVTLAEARRQQKMLQAHYHDVRVVRGHCPSGGFPEDWDEPRPGIQIIVLEKHLKRAIELMRELIDGTALREVERTRLQDFVETVEGTI